MTPKQLAEIIAIFRKLEIENNPNLSHEEKELLKLAIDELKKQIKQKTVLKMKKTMAKCPGNQGGVKEILKFYHKEKK